MSETKDPKAEENMALELAAELAGAEVEKVQELIAEEGVADTAEIKIVAPAEGGMPSEAELRAMIENAQPLPRGNHRHTKGPIKSKAGNAAKKKARKRTRKARQRNRK